MCIPNHKFNLKDCYPIPFMIVFYSAKICIFIYAISCNSVSRDPIRPNTDIKNNKLWAVSNKKTQIVSDFKQMKEN